MAITTNERNLIQLKAAINETPVYQIQQKTSNLSTPFFTLINTHRYTDFVYADLVVVSGLGGNMLLKSMNIDSNSDAQSARKQCNSYRYNTIEIYTMLYSCRDTITQTLQNPRIFIYNYKRYSEWRVVTMYILFIAVQQVTANLWKTEILHIMLD